MLACGLDVRITFDKTLTVVSAVVAILFTFAAFSSGYATEAIENSQPIVSLVKWGKSLRSSIQSSLHGHPAIDPEAGYLPVAGSDHGDEERLPILVSTSDQGYDDDEEEAHGPLGAHASG